MELETKAVEHGPNNPYDVKQAFDEFLSGFAAFRQANDERLQGLERRSGDVLNEEKVARIDAHLTETRAKIDQLMLASARPVLGGERKAFDPQLSERKARFDRYVRKGDGLDIEVKAMSEGSNADGGYTVPLEIERTIDRVLTQASPIRAIAGVRQIGGGTYRKPITTSGAASGWVGETGSITQTGTPTLAALDFPAMELYAMPAATQTLLDDSHVDIEQWLADEVQIVFAEQEGAAFVQGDGSNKPKGFLNYTNVADASWSWGNIGYVASGADGAFLADEDAPADALLNLAYAPKQGYRANGRWVMNRKTESAVRKFKDANGNYIWQPATIFGYAVTEAEDMPDIASNSYSIAFGDFARGYLIVDRVGIRVLPLDPKNLNTPPSPTDLQQIQNMLDKLSRGRPEDVKQIAPKAYNNYPSSITGAMLPPSVAGYTSFAIGSRSLSKRLIIDNAPGATYYANNHYLSFYHVH